MKVEFAVKKWINSKFDELSGFTAGKDYRMMGVENVRKIISQLEKSTRADDYEIVNILRGHKWHLRHLGFKLSDYDLVKIADKLVEVYPSLKRDSKLKYLLEFRSF